MDFKTATIVYIDFANVVHWSQKLGWHVDVRCLKHYLDSFPEIKKVRFYYGTIADDKKSEEIISQAKKYGYDVATKPVKTIRLSIDTTSISADSPALIAQFIRKPFLSKLHVEDIEYLNARLRELNNQGIKYLEDKKCNFDVEIGRDMLLDYSQKKADNFILWSGDSDFADPVSQLLKDGKKVVIYSTARRVSKELAETGAKIFDIQKIRNQICWPRERKKESPKATPSALKH